MDSSLITGLHHVTAIAASASTNVEFYAGVLGLRLVKKTVNFDAPAVYHLYYGDGDGTPGSIMTFFPYPGLVRGRQGRGQVTTTAFSVPFGALGYWGERLERFDVPHRPPQERFSNEVFIYLEDPDGLGLELVFNAADQRRGYAGGAVPAANAISGFHHVAITLDTYERTGALLTGLLGLELVKEGGNRFRFGRGDLPGHLIDLVCSPDGMKGRNGSGTVHHVALATRTRAALLEMRARLEERGLQPTEVRDRKYFESVYFREPSGVLFEIATTDRGFGVDETNEHLGEGLMLPAWLETQRAGIAAALPSIEVNLKKYYDHA